MAGPSDGTVALQSPRATVTAPAPAPAAAAGATIDGRNSNTDSAADTESPAVMAERAKRPAGAAAGCDEHPVGRGKLCHPYVVWAKDRMLSMLTVHGLTPLLARSY